MTDNRYCMTFQARFFIRSPLRRVLGGQRGGWISRWSAPIETPLAAELAESPATTVVRLGCHTRVEPAARRGQQCPEFRVRCRVRMGLAVGGSTLSASQSDPGRQRSPGCREQPCPTASPLIRLPLVRLAQRAGGNQPPLSIWAADSGCRRADPQIPSMSFPTASRMARMACVSAFIFFLVG